MALIESSHNVVEQYVGRKNLVISGIPDSVKDSELKSTVASILSDIDIMLNLRELEDYYKWL